MRKKSLIVIILIIIIDQISKYFIAKNGANFSIIPNAIAISYVKNKGIAFGLINKDLITVIITNIIVLAIIIRFYILQKDRIDKKTNIALILIIAGGISNLIDRIFRFGVVDYIKIELFKFPIFNIADLCIFMGFVIFIVVIAMQMKDIKQEDLLKKMK